uniref:Ectonucleoside triphosphate diphosphohydrolase 5b n=1 Tax=Eptatretus burgeri TaxID=7764 RepID=A0A8C4NFB1_EPTBU
MMGALFYVLCIAGATTAQNIMEEAFAARTGARLGSMGLNVNLGTGGQRFHVLVDAGSTGTRLHVFAFRSDAADGNLEFLHERFLSLEPGLSTYAKEPEKCVGPLRELLAFAQRHVPPPQWSRTPLALLATAGLRLLPTHRAHALLEQVRREFLHSPFIVNNDSVAIMNGSDEGFLAWLSINFLKGTLKKPFHESLGILDLGGGSTQICFHTQHKETIHSAPEGFVQLVQVSGASFTLYCPSYLGLGLMSARLAVLGGADSARAENLTNPCLPKGYNGEWRYGSTSYMLLGPREEERQGGYEACFESMKALVERKTHRTMEAPHVHFYAFSYYFDRAMDTSMIEGEAGRNLSIWEFNKKAKETCNQKDPKHPFLCMDLTYIAVLLLHGFNFASDTIIQIAKKVNSVETGWALGAALRHLQALDLLT